MKFLHNTSRIEAFSDAVFAFAATLMVVSLDANEDFLLVASTTTSFVSFGASFFVLATLWKLHYNFFRRTNYVDDLIIAINIILLFVVLYYVFPLKSLLNSLLGRQGITLKGLAALFELYGLGFLLIFLCFSLMYYRAYKKCKEVENSIDLLFYTRHFAIFVIVAVISITLAFLKVGVRFGFPGFIYALLGPFCYFHGQWFKHKIRNRF